MGVEIEKLDMPSYEQIENVLLTQRSIRAHKDKTVEKKVIERTLRAAVHTSNVRYA